MSHQVTIYTLPTCEYCKDAKAYFKEHGIAYKELDVDKNNAAAAEMVAKTGQYGVPVIDIDGQIVVGFQKDALDVMIS